MPRETIPKSTHDFLALAGSTAASSASPGQPSADAVQEPEPFPPEAGEQYAPKPPLEVLTGGKPTTKPRRAREKESLWILPEVRNAMRNTVYHLQGPPQCLNLSSFIEGAIQSEIQRLSQEHNNGEPFPQRPGELKVGRPIR